MEHGRHHGGVAIATTAVRLHGVSVAYGARLALDGVDLEVAAGSLLAIIGPNGAGKSTLLRLLAGLISAQRGEVEVLGGAAGRTGHRVAYVPQAETVDWEFPVTVGEVVMMGRYPRIGIGRSPSAVDRVAVAEALDAVAMGAHRDTQIGSLSGGQRRRAFLARALAAEPDLFLLDEPVTGVDATTQEDLMDVLEAEARAGRTVVATTHDLACAAHRFQDAVLINGRIVAQGPAKTLVLDPDLLAATYGGHVLVMPDSTGGTLVLDDAHHHADDTDETHAHGPERR